MASKCSSPPKYNTFHYTGIYYAGATSLGLGAYIGILTRFKYFIDEQTNNKWFMMLIRTIILLVVIYSTQLLDNIVPFENLATIFLLKGFFPQFLAGFLSFFLPELFLNTLRKTKTN